MRRARMDLARPGARPRIALIAAGLIMLVGLGLLLRGALASAEREQQLRREALAARVFDELEATLAAFVAAEEARPFVQWRRDWVAPPSLDEIEPALTRSPLATIPERPFVLGYFQIEPDGSFASPMLPDPNEGAALDEPVLARVEQLRALNEDLAGAERLALAEAPEPELPQQAMQQQAVPAQAKQKAVPEDVQIQRALDQQSIVRQRKNALGNQNSFNPDREQLSNFVGPGNDISTIEAGPGDALDLRVTGFVAQPLGDALRLIRTVEIGEQRWVQGLVVDRGALERWLEQEVLGSPELAGFVELEWDPGADTNADTGRWTHQFAAPFSSLQVTAALGPADALASSSARLILGLGLGLALALIVGLLAVDRSLTGLIERAEERERFVAAVTHELRTPLTSIRMYSEMLEQGMVTDAERQRGYHGTIRAEAERLSRLVEQVLTLARVEERERSLVGEGERGRVDAIVNGVVELLSPQAAARELQLEIDIDPEAASQQLPRDPLAQILTNLIDNALKFTPTGAVEPIEIVARRRPASISFTVRDAGPGVASELLARMFEPFVRGRREHAQAVQGTGIGLAVVRALVEELGGQVSGRNREGGAGFEIEVELPST